MWSFYTQEQMLLVWTVKSNKLKNNSKNSEFFCAILSQMFVVPAKFHRKIVLVEGVVKKTKSMLRKCYLQKHFGALILSFYTLSTNVISRWNFACTTNIYESMSQNNFRIFWTFFLFFWFYYSYQEHLLLGVERYFLYRSNIYDNIRNSLCLSVCYLPEIRSSVSSYLVKSRYRKSLYSFCNTLSCN